MKTDGIYNQGEEWQGGGWGQKLENYYKDTSQIGGFLLNQLNRKLAEGRPGWGSLSKLFMVTDSY